MKLYYKNKYCSLFKGDCIEVLKRLKRKFDCCITDPPYGNDFDQPWLLSLEAIKLAQKKSKMQIIITDWRHPLTVDNNKFGELVWEYGWVSGGRSKSNHFYPTHNLIHFLGENLFSFEAKNGSILYRRPGFSSPRQCSFAKKTGHPYEKPIALISYLVERSSCNTFLDPFCGSGTLGVASMRAKKYAVMIEREERYCDMAAIRLSEEYKKLKE